MSQWTHLAGLIRLDKIPILQFSATSYEDVYKAFSPEPVGSEGPVQTRYASVNKHQGDVRDGYLVIWGDLRDFGIEDYEKIQKWWEKGLKALGPLFYLVRQAVLEVRIEYHGTFILGYDQLNEKVTETFTEDPDHIEMMKEKEKDEEASSK